VTTNISIQELVRKDLLWAEQQGTLAEPYTGNEAILDAYEVAMDLVCYLRQLIEDMTIGEQLYRQPRGERL
jgi:hypothetical protein